MLHRIVTYLMQLTVITKCDLVQGLATYGPEARCSLQNCGFDSRTLSLYHATVSANLTQVVGKFCCTTVYLNGGKRQQGQKLDPNVCQPPT